MAPLIRHAEVPVNFQHVPLGAPSPPGSLTLIRRGLTRAAFDAAGSVLSKLRSAWSSTPKSVPQFPEKPPEKFYEAPSWWSSFIFGSSDKLQTNREMIYGTAYRDRPVSNYGDLEAMSFELNKGRLGELRALKAQKVKEEKKLDKKPKQTNSDIIKLDQIKADVKGLEEEMKKLLRSAEEHVARLNRPEHINAWDDSKKPDFQRGLEDSLVVGPEIESGYNGESSVTQMPGAWIYSPTTGRGLPYSWKLDTNSEHPSTTGGNAFERKVRLGDDLMTSGLLSDKPKVRFEEPLPTPNERTRAVKEKKGKDARKGKGGGRAPVDWEKTWEEESDGDKSKKGGKGKKGNKKGDKDKKSGKIITDQVLDSWTQEVYVSPHAVSAYNPEPDLSYTGEKLTPLLGWHLPNDSTGATGPSIFNTKLSTAFGAFGLPDYDGISEMNTDSMIADMSNRVTGKETPKKIDKGKGRECNYPYRSQCV